MSRTSAMASPEPADYHRYEKGNVLRLAVVQALAGANATVVYATGAIVGNMLFEGHRPEKMGYAIEGVEEAGGGEAAAVPIASLLPTADAAKGAEVFKKCAACHTINQGGANGVGPNLYATMGEAIAQGKGGFAFSDALKSVGGNWDFDKMNAWLTSPRSRSASSSACHSASLTPRSMVYSNVMRRPVTP